MTTYIRRLVRIAAIASFSLILGCTSSPDETRVRFMAMGTLVEVTIYYHPPKSAAVAIDEIESLFADLETRWDPWEGGELASLNAKLGNGSQVTPPKDLADLLSRASHLDEVSGGLFEPAIGSLTRLWGFSNEESAPTSPPQRE